MSFSTISSTSVFVPVPPPQPQAPVVSEPKDGIYKPNRYKYSYWPAIRARNFVKEINKTSPRMTFHNNLLYLAEHSYMPIAELIKTSPIVVAKRLGIPQHRVCQIIGSNYRYL